MAGLRQFNYFNIINLISNAMFFFLWILTITKFFLSYIQILALFIHRDNNHCRFMVINDKS